MKGQYKKNSSAETGRKLKILLDLQRLSLNNKINISNDIIKKSLEIGKPALLYSGGKDSTVLLNMLLEYDKNILIIYNNTGLADEKHNKQIREICKNYNFIETKAQDYIGMWQKKGYYPILSKRGFTKYKKQDPTLRISPVQCCYQLKEIYSNKIFKDNEIKVVFWGNRAGESNRRKLSFVDNGFLFKPKKYKWYQSYPLQHFTDNDILEYLVKYVKNYNISTNFESGCLACGVDITYKDNNLRRLYFNDKALFTKVMESGYAEQILKIKGIKYDAEILKDIIYNKPEILLKI
jgi:3'-phosphoadenosine 5'-phosphosulfate sulfotransferase (PAPS reductase)/FAD synthetase